MVTTRGTYGIPGKVLVVPRQPGAAKGFKITKQSIGVEDFVSKCTCYLSTAHEALRSSCFEYFIAYQIDFSYIYIYIIYKCFRYLKSSFVDANKVYVNWLETRLSRYYLEYQEKGLKFFLFSGFRVSFQVRSQELTAVYRISFETGEGRVINIDVEGK